MPGHEYGQRLGAQMHSMTTTMAKPSARWWRGQLVEGLEHRQYLAEVFRGRCGIGPAGRRHVGNHGQQALDKPITAVGRVMQGAGEIGLDAAGDTDDGLRDIDRPTALA